MTIRKILEFIFQLPVKTTLLAILHSKSWESFCSKRFFIIRRILLPGYSAANSTARSFIRYTQQKGIEVSVIDHVKPETLFKIWFKGRSIDCVVLNSHQQHQRLSVTFFWSKLEEI